MTDKGTKPERRSWSLSAQQVLRRWGDLLGGWMTGGLVVDTLNEERDVNPAQPLFEHISYARSDPEMVQLAVQLIDHQTARTIPPTSNRYETRLRAMLDAKVKAAIEEDVPAPVSSNIIDLMAALRTSLGETPKLVAAPPSVSVPKASPKRAQKSAEQQRKQLGLKLPIEGGRKVGKETAAPVAELPNRPRRRA